MGGSRPVDKSKHGFVYFIFKTFWKRKRVILCTPYMHYYFIKVFILYDLSLLNTEGDWMYWEFKVIKTESIRMNTVWVYSHVIQTSLVAQQWSWIDCLWMSEQGRENLFYILKSKGALIYCIPFPQESSVKCFILIIQNTLTSLKYLAWF